MLLRIGAGVVGAFLLAVLALPLVLRGPVARWMVRRATASMCGTVGIAGARAGWAAAIDLILGRPFPLSVDGLEIKGPDGQIVAAAARVEGEMAIHRGGVIDVTWVRVAQGSWRLDLDTDGLGTVDAFRSVPPAGRAACLDPHATRRAGKSKAGGGALTLRRVEIADLDVELTFDTWGMTLAGAAAVGSLSAGGDPAFLFEARDVVARGGSVRIGGPKSPWRTVVPLDAARITRVGVLRDAPTDLTLEVASGVTGRSLLSGRASFLNIFPGPGGRPPPGRAGLDADVRWAAFGDALARLQATWRPTGGWARGIGGDLHALVRGPFSGLEGVLDIDGGPIKVAARLGDSRADLRVNLQRVDTTRMLDPALRPLLGGDLHGRLHATARLAPRFADVEVDLPDADLRLDLRRAPRGPDAYELRIGAAARRAPGRSSTTAQPSRTLDASIERVRLAGAAMQLRGLRVDWSGLSAALDAELVFPADATDGERTRSRVDAHGSLAVAALQDWVPPAIASGPLRVDARAAGTIDRVALKLAFPPPASLLVVGQRLLLPRRVDALWSSEGGLRVTPFQLKRAAGGTVRLGGRVGPDDRLGVSVGMSDYPLAALLAMASTGLPPATGVAAADLTLNGTTGRPAISGKVEIATLTVARRPIGNVSADLRIAGEAGDVTASIDPGVTVHARVKRRGALSVEAEVEAHDRALGPWLPPPLAGAPLTTSGRATLAYRAGAPLEADAALTVAGPGLTGLRVDARLRGADGSGNVSGAVDVARWPQLWSRYVKSASGTLDLDVGVQDVLIRPRGVGALRVTRDVVVRTGAWPAPLTLAAGGRFDLDGTAVTATDVAVRTPGLSARLGGRATLDLDDVGRTALALRLDGDLDAARFPVRLPSGVSVGGRLAVQVQVGGTLAGVPGPRLDGTARLDDVTVRLSPTTPLAHGRGTVEAHGDRVRTNGVDVQVDGLGMIRVGRGDAPAVVRVVSLSPFRLGEVDVPFSGANLTIGTPSSQLYLPDVDASMRLAGDARGELILAGEVSVSGGVLDPSKKSAAKPVVPGAAAARPPAAPAKPRVSGAWWRALPPHLTLDLDLRAVNKGIHVEVPVLPDVNVDLRCHLHANNRGANWSGRLRGNGAYARAAVTLFDWFKAEDLRGCQLTN
ncbi:MAG TPA: hypothetical protein VHM31_18195 [Polyangia bacterium]|nr:hypothetical protein [Polyangia bacterium]